VFEIPVKNVAFNTVEVVLVSLLKRPHPLTVKLVPTNCSVVSGGKHTTPAKLLADAMLTDEESLKIE
jgi:hypothetical protein